MLAHDPGQPSDVRDRAGSDRLEFGNDAGTDAIAAERYVVVARVSPPLQAASVRIVTQRATAHLEQRPHHDQTVVVNA